MYFGTKIIVIGCYSTGKTTLVNRLCGYEVNLWDIKPTTSPGVCIYHGATMFDTCGEERYYSLNKLYFRNSDIVILCGENHDRINTALNNLYFPNEELMNTPHYLIITQTKNDISPTISFNPYSKLPNTYFASVSGLTGDGLLQLSGILLHILYIVNNKKEDVKNVIVERKSKCCK